MAPRWKGKGPPKLLLSIDPGAHWRASNGHPYAGCALFQWNTLIWAQLVKAPSVAPASDHWPFLLVDRICKESGVARFFGQNENVVTALAVEKPILYTRGTARPQDIIDLREIYGACMAGIEADTYFGPQPGEWKGSIDPLVLCERVLQVVTPGEKTILIQSEACGTGGMSDHVIDAVGIGLFTMGRMWKGGIKPS